MHVFFSIIGCHQPNLEFSGCLPGRHFRPCGSKHLEFGHQPFTNYRGHWGRGFCHSLGLSSQPRNQGQDCASLIVELARCNSRIRTLSGGNNALYIFLLWPSKMIPFFVTFLVVQGYTLQNDFPRNFLLLDSSGQHLLTGTSKGFVLKYSNKSGWEILHLDPENGSLCLMSLSPCNTMVAIGSGTCSLTLLSLDGAFQV